MTGSTVRVITAPCCCRIRASLAVLCANQAGSRLRHLRAGLRHHRVFVLGRHTSRLRRFDPRSAVIGFLCWSCRCVRAPTAARYRSAERPHRLRGRRRQPGSTISRGPEPTGTTSDPTLNLDILEVFLLTLSRWKIIETPQRLETVHRIIGFQKRLVVPARSYVSRSHIYYLPELYLAYFGRC